MDTEAEQKVLAMEMIAPIVEAQMRFDQNITNDLMSKAWGAAATWATRFQSLISAIEKQNDSLRVAHVLDAHWQPDMKRQIEHYKHMSGETEGEAY